MGPAPRDPAAAVPRRLFTYTLGFLRPAMRRMLAAAGHEVRLGLPGPGDGVAVWGRSPHAWRGERMAARQAVPLIRIEDAFLRGLRSGRQGGGAPLGLLIDPYGVHFDARGPSMTEHIGMHDPLDDSHLLSRARDGMARLRALDLSKYNIHDIHAALPPAGYILIVDQARGDASITHSGTRASVFREMLGAALIDYPGSRIVIKTHPETAAGLRPGHFGPEDAGGAVTVLTDPVSPWRLLEGATQVFTLSSQMGFEAIMAGHRPRVWGQPFYAGWGLTKDELPIPRRRPLTRAQLFAVAMILAPTWVCPCRGRMMTFEEAVDQLEAQTRAFRADRAGHVATGMRLWKRGRLQAVFGREKPVIFRNEPMMAAKLAAETGRGLLIWASKEPPGLAAPRILRVEDGFLRSRGLGAALVPPLSLVTDSRGIYYDPARPSDLEALILAPPPPGGLARAERLVARLVAEGVTKYNLHGPVPDLPPGHRILVPGQVEDDASIRLGAGAVKTNAGLLSAVRAARPDAVIVYKPHPDVEAGLRPGAVAPDALAALADVVAHRSDVAALIAACDEVWTITSLLGFEALLRGTPVTCLGAPFYAGWGLTTDLGPVPARRRHAADGHPLPRPGLMALAHAALIAYPRYMDPVTLLPCPPEVAVDRLASGRIPAPSLANRLLSKAQGALASRAHLWR